MAKHIHGDKRRSFLTGMFNLPGVSAFTEEGKLVPDRKAYPKHRSAF